MKRPTEFIAIPTVDDPTLWVKVRNIAYLEEDEWTTTVWHLVGEAAISTSTLLSATEIQQMMGQIEEKMEAYSDYIFNLNFNNDSGE